MAGDQELQEARLPSWLESFTPAPMPHRRRSSLPRFGLRSLFVFALAFCLLFGWIGRNLYHTRQQQVALQALDRVQAKLTLYESDGGNHGDARAFPLPDESLMRYLDWSDELRVRSVFLWTSRQSNPAGVSRAMAVLPTFEELEWVSLSGPEINDNSMLELQRLPNLRKVWLDRTQVTSAGLSHLGPIPNLQELRIFDSQRFGPGLMQLTELRTLVIADSPLTRAEVEAIVSLPKLESLTFTDVEPLDPDTYVPLEKAVGLKSLTISDGRPHDWNTKRLAKLETLEHLSIGGISDGGLAQLAALPNLRKIEFDAGVSREAALQFSEDHPECMIRHNFGGAGCYYRNGRALDESELTPAEANVWTGGRGL